MLKSVVAEAGAYLDGYFRLLASIIVSSYVTFLFTWGSVALLSWKFTGIWIGLGVGFATALVATGLIIYNLWTRSPLTKGIPLAVPAEISQEAAKQNINIVERK
jgi:hypothetical protein